MSKAARIRELYAEGHSTRAIADIVGCRPEYVRTAARQRVGGHFSESDARYVTKKYNTTDVHEGFRRAFNEYYVAKKRAGDTPCT